MNSKNLKKLRAYIRKMFAGLPERGHIVPPLRGYLTPDWSHLNPDGTQKMTMQYKTGTITNDLNTLRGAYRKARKMGLSVPV